MTCYCLLRTRALVPWLLNEYSSAIQWWQCSALQKYGVLGGWGRREYTVIPFLYNSRKHKLTHRDRQQLSGCLGIEGREKWEAEITKRWEILAGNGCAHCLIMISLCLHMSKHQILHFQQETLCCVDYPLIKLFTKIQIEMIHLLGGSTMIISTF